LRAARVITQPRCKRCERVSVGGVPLHLLHRDENGSSASAAENRLSHAYDDDDAAARRRRSCRRVGPARRASPSVFAVPSDFSDCLFCRRARRATSQALRLFISGRDPPAGHTEWRGMDAERMGATAMGQIIIILIIIIIIIMFYFAIMAARTIQLNTDIHAHANASTKNTQT